MNSLTFWNVIPSCRGRIAANPKASVHVRHVEWLHRRKLTRNPKIPKKQPSKAGPALSEYSTMSDSSYPASVEASSGARFTTTHWTMVLAAAETAAPGGQEALEKLCRTYWPPVYACIRRRGNNPDDARDLTQEFFARFLERSGSSWPTASAAGFVPSSWPRSRAS